jgi:hypothetical protein
LTFDPLERLLKVGIIEIERSVKLKNVHRTTAPAGTAPQKNEGGAQECGATKKASKIAGTRLDISDYILAGHSPVSSRGGLH